MLSRVKFVFVKFVFLLVASSLCAAQAAAQAQTVRVSAEAGAAPRALWKDVRVEFEGNRLFTSERLRALASECYGRSRGADEMFEPEILDYCLRVNVLGFVRRSGYLRARLGERRTERTPAGETVTVPLDEKELYRLGEVTIAGAEFFDAARLREMLPLRAGDIADAEAVGRWLSEHLKERYGDEGFVQYEFELEPEFRLDTATGEGVADLKVTINEGRRFRLRRLAFAGGENLPEDVLRGAMRLREGEFFSARAFAGAVRRLNSLDLFGAGRFEPVDRDKDSEFRADEEAAELDITIHLTETGRARPARGATTEEEARPGHPTLKNRRPQTREE
jgi:outer membrane protein insertion porin family